MFRAVVLALDYQLGGERDDLSLGDVLHDRTALEPSEELEAREMRGYLRDAVELLPERHRLVIVGYFLESRTSEELARFLDVTESRISQLRSEALIMLREGIDCQYRDGERSVDPRGRVARRKAGYATAIGEKSTGRPVDERTRPVADRVKALPEERFCGIPAATDIGGSYAGAGAKQLQPAAMGRRPVCIPRSIFVLSGEATK